MNMLIIGYGATGQAMHSRFPHAHIHDEEAGRKAGTVIDVSTLSAPDEYVVETDTHYDLALICIDDPVDSSGVVVELSAIEKQIQIWKDAADAFAIYSAIDDKAISVLRDKGFAVLTTDEQEHLISSKPIEETIDWQEIVNRLREDRDNLLESVKTARRQLDDAKTAIESLELQVASLRGDMALRDAQLESVRSMLNGLIDQKRAEKKRK